MEDLVLGYGINQIGACNRDGSLNSFDISFETKEEAEEYYSDICASGYGSRYNQIIEITLEDDLKPYLRSYFEDIDYISDEEIDRICAYYTERFGIYINTDTWNRVINSL